MFNARGLILAKLNNGETPEIKEAPQEMVSQEKKIKIPPDPINKTAVLKNMHQDFPYQDHRFYYRSLTAEPGKPFFPDTMPPFLDFIITLASSFENNNGETFNILGLGSGTLGIEVLAAHVLEEMSIAHSITAVEKQTKAIEMRQAFDRLTDRPSIEDLGINVVNEDFCNVYFPENCHLITAINSLTHIPNSAFEEILPKILQSLAVDGLFVFTVFDKKHDFVVNGNPLLYTHFKNETEVRNCLNMLIKKSNGSFEITYLQKFDDNGWVVYEVIIKRLPEKN